MTGPDEAATELPPVEVAPPPSVKPPPSPEPRSEPAPRDVTRSAPVREGGTVKDTVERFAGQVQYCYEKQLVTNPTLEGRVEVGWTVSGGAVSGTPSIVANTTGDAALADCISGKIRRWRFPPGVEGDVSWPFVFQAKK